MPGPKEMLVRTKWKVHISSQTFVVGLLVHERRFVWLFFFFFSKRTYSNISCTLICICVCLLTPPVRGDRVGSSGGSRTKTLVSIVIFTGTNWYNISSMATHPHPSPAVLREHACMSVKERGGERSEGAEVLIGLFFRRFHSAWTKAESMGGF